VYWRVTTVILLASGRYPKGNGERPRGRGSRGRLTLTNSGREALSVAHRSDESFVEINRDRSGDAGRDLNRSDRNGKGIGEEEEEGNKNGEDGEMHLGFFLNMSGCWVNELTVDVTKS
jgi:hypothetical protein